MTYACAISSDLIVRITLPRSPWPQPSEDGGIIVRLSGRADVRGKKKQNVSIYVNRV